MSASTSGINPSMPRPAPRSVTRLEVALWFGMICGVLGNLAMQVGVDGRAKAMRAEIDAMRRTVDGLVAAVDGYPQQLNDVSREHREDRTRVAELEQERIRESVREVGAAVKAAQDKIDAVGIKADEALQRLRVIAPKTADPGTPEPNPPCPAEARS